MILQIHSIGSGIGYLLITIKRATLCQLFLKRNHAKGEVCRQENNRKAVRKTIGSCLAQENHREVFHQILQTGPPSLSVPPGLPEPNDVSMAWLCHRSYEAMTEVRPRLYRGHSYEQPTKTYPVRQGGIFEISKKA